MGNLCSGGADKHSDDSRGNNQNTAGKKPKGKGMAVDGPS